MKNLCAWDSKQLSEWKEFLSCVGKLTSKKEPTWELNQILTLGSTLNFFWQTFKMRDSQIYRVLSIPQRQEYLLLGALAESRLHSNLSFFFEGPFFILLNTSENCLQRRDYETFLPVKKHNYRIIQVWKDLISSEVPHLAQSLGNGKVSPSCSGLFSLSWKSPRRKPAQTFWSTTAWLSAEGEFLLYQVWAP